MLTNKTEGTHFWYADRKSKKPIECEIVAREYGYPERIWAKTIPDGQTFRCFPSFGCYDLQSYSHALKDAETEEERIIY